jgi:APA family basic amino acid/polyamine antiporter
MSTGPSQKIGLLTATIVGMNAMIGAGIFTIPSALAGHAGPASILTFVFVAFAVWCMAQSIARVAQLFPQEGSFYAYVRPWGGHGMGLFAAACYLFGIIIAMGFLTHSAGEHLARYLSSSSSQFLGGVSLIALTFLNLFGVSLSSISQQILILLTVFPLLATTVLCFTKASLSNLVPFAPYGIKSVFEQTRTVAFSFFGFEAIASLFAIIRDPQKNLPRAISYSLLIVAGLYLLFVASLILAVPLHYFSQYPGPVANALIHVFPGKDWVIECIHISSLFAILGTLHSMIWASGALTLSFFKKIRACSTQQLLVCGAINRQSTTLFIGGCIFGSFYLLSSKLFCSLTSLFLLTSYVLAMITLLTIPSEWKSGRNTITIAGIATAVLIFYFAADDCRKLAMKKLCSTAATVCKTIS